VQPYGVLPSFPPTVSQATTPSTISVFNKGLAKFTAAFIGTPPIAYQWRFTTNGLDYTDLPSATNTALLISNAQPANAGYYSLWASNAVNGGYTAGSGNGPRLVLGPAPALKPFPLSANGRGTVTCLENPSITYDMYLPPGYSTNGPPLPILYTLWASGGGIVSPFQLICSNMNIITVGITGSKNNVPLDVFLREFYAVTRDIRQRVLFDPTAEFCAGESGGGENSYVFSRFRSQHVSGLLEMAGWLGRINSGPSTVNYYSNDRVQTNLFVARTTGLSDSGGLFYNPFDSNYLASCGAVIQDWFFNGGHGIAPDDLKISTLQWLISQRTPAGVYDASNALAQAADWRSRLSSGDSENVLRECVGTLMARPRTWFAAEAQLVLDDMMTNYTAFRSINVSNLFPASTSFITNNFSVSTTNIWSQSDLASDTFYYYARGAATNKDMQRYYCCMKILTGIPGVNNDRLGDFFNLLKTNSCPPPILKTSVDQDTAQVNIWLQKDAPSLAYTLQSRDALIGSTWQDYFPSSSETDTVWSATIPLDSAPTNAFYRMRAIPTLLGPSPPFPPF
jgi:hypothetical protein